MDDAPADRRWLRRPEWASGEIHSHARSAAFVALAVAVFWNAISWTCVIAAREILFEKPIAQAIWILLFPAVGIGLAAWAGRALVRLRVYGDSRFVMSSVPGQIGGTLAGVIRAAHPLSPLRPARVTLACVRRSTTGSGDSRSTTETVLWSDKTAVRADASGAIPVAFYIPDDCLESDDSRRDDTILWQMQASMPGAIVSYRARFEVPVFKVAETPAQVADALRIRQEHELRVSEYQPGAHSSIRVRLAPDGSTEAYFPPMRAPFAVLTVLVFFAVWTAIARTLIVKDAPLIFRVVWPLTDLVLFGGLIALAGGSSVANARADGLVIAKRLFGIPCSRSRVPADSIKSIRAAPGFTAGSTVYSRIRVDLKNGNSRYFGDGIADVNHAEWIALKLARALNLSDAAESEAVKRSA